MDRWQNARQIAWLLERLVWTDPPFEPVLSGGAHVSEDEPENYLPAAPNAKGPPFALVDALGATPDPELPSRMLESRFRVRVVALGKLSRHGTAALVGGPRSAVFGQGKSEGRGALEVLGRIHEALGEIDDGAHALAGAILAFRRLRPIQGLHLVEIEIEIAAFNETAARFYHPPVELVAQGGAGSATLSWTLPPPRFDLVGVVLRRADPGKPAPATPSDGAPVPTAPLATGVTVSGLSPGQHSFALFAGYDETSGAPIVPDRFSAAITTSAVVS